MTHWNSSAGGRRPVRQGRPGGLWRRRSDHLTSSRRGGGTDRRRRPHWPDRVFRPPRVQPTPSGSPTSRPPAGGFSVRWRLTPCGSHRRFRTRVGTTRRRSRGSRTRAGQRHPGLRRTPARAPREQAAQVGLSADGEPVTSRFLGPSRSDLPVRTPAATDLGPLASVLLTCPDGAPAGNREGRGRWTTDWRDRRGDERART